MAKTYNSDNAILIGTEIGAKYSTDGQVHRFARVIPVPAVSAEGLDEAGAKRAVEAFINEKLPDEVQYVTATGRTVTVNLRENGRLKGAWKPNSWRDVYSALLNQLVSRNRSIIGAYLTAEYGKAKKSQRTASADDEFFA